MTEVAPVDNLGRLVQALDESDLFEVVGVRDWSRYDRPGTEFLTGHELILGSLAVRKVDLWTHPSEPIYDQTRLSLATADLLDEAGIVDFEFREYYEKGFIPPQVTIADTVGQMTVSLVGNLKPEFGVQIDPSLPSAIVEDTAIDLHQITTLRVLPDKAHALRAMTGYRDANVISEKALGTFSEHNEGFRTTVDDRRHLFF